MHELQNTLLEWFGQFTPNVYVLGDEYMLDPTTGEQKIKPLPLISFGYATSDFAENTLMTFNIWSESFNWIEVLSIEGRIAKALPSNSDVMFELKSGSIYEYLNPSTGKWREFEIDEFNQLAQRIWDDYKQTVEWRETPGQLRGAIWLQRGNPFTQSVPDPDYLIKRRMGNIIIRSYTTY